MKKKKNQKKAGVFVLSVLLMLGLLLTLAGCGGDGSSAGAEENTIGEQANAAGTGSTASVIQIHTKGVEPKTEGIPDSRTDSGEVDTSGIDKEKPMIALTFDDGPGDGTERILRVLQENGAKATFFELGGRIQARPELSKKLAEAGMQMASHTYDHPDLTKISEEDVSSQYTRAEKAMEKATGGKPTALRPPYGASNERVRSQTPYPLILWNVDSEDWSSRDAEAICNAVYDANPGDGDILLFHDIYDSTADAIETLVPYFKEKGYQMVTVEQMFAAKGIELKNGTLYYNA